MSKVGIVFKFETIRQLKKPSFWISLLLLPLAIVGILGLSTLSGASMEEMMMNQDFSDKKLGLTDGANIIAQSEIPFEKIDSEEEGKKKVQSGELDIYYYILDNFSESRKIKIYDRAEDASLMSINSMPIINILKSSVYSKLTIEDIILIENGVEYENIDLDEKGEQVNIIGRAIIPLAILAVFYILICVFGNRLTMALVEEKENRISEMILTSVTSKTFVIGKIFSLIALGFVQIAVFLAPVIAALIIFRDNPMVSSIIATIDWDPVCIIENLLLLLFSYFMFAGSCMFISSLCPTARDASQYIGVVMIGVVAPLMFLGNLISNTPDAATYILTYFPLSSPIALMIRNALGNLPTLELIIGIVEIGIASAISLGLTVKSFQKNAINFSVVKPHFGPKKSWKR